MGIKFKNKEKIRDFRKSQRVGRVRAVVSGTAQRPRLAVARTLKHVRAQIIDDAAGKTIIAAGDHELKGGFKNKVEAAAAVGKLIAEKALAAGIKGIVFDRRSNRYHGRIKALADAAREAGLNF